MNFESLFRTKKYLEAYPELPFRKKKGAWSHFQSFGWKENRYAAFKDRETFDKYVQYKKNIDEKKVVEEKVIIWKQKGGFFNKCRLLSNIPSFQKEKLKFIILDEPDNELNCYFFDFFKKKLDFKFKKINSLKEIKDFENNYVYINEYNFKYFLVEKRHLLKYFSQKYIYIEYGGLYNYNSISNKNLFSFLGTLKIDFSSDDDKIRSNLINYKNIICLRCAPHEFNIYDYLSNKICFYNIELANLATTKWRNFYRLDLNKNMINFIKKNDNSVLLLDYMNDDIKKIITENNINYLDIYNKNNRNENGINEYLKKYLVLNSIENDINIYYSGYSSNCLIGKKKIKIQDVYPKININLDICNKSIPSYYKHDKTKKYDINLTENINENYDNIFNSIYIFNKMLVNFSYKISVDSFLNIDLSVNKDIIKLNNEWQQPIATEYYTYLQLRYHNLKFKYIAYPWANMIDNWSHNKNIKKYNFPVSSLYFDDMEEIKNMKLDNCVTVIQHILYYKMIPFLKSLGIKYVFASHCLKETVVLNVKIFPYFLYCNTYNITPSNNNSNLLCNGIYGVNTNKNREKTIDLLNRSKFINIKKNNSWFFQEFVYELQIRKKKITTHNLFNENIEYIKYISESSFQICLAGSGKNTIRLFESLKLKIVPLIDFDIEYKSSIFKFNDYVIKINIDDIIEHLKNEDLDTYIINGFKLLELIKIKRKNIERDYNNISNLDLYSSYIKEKL